VNKVEQMMLGATQWMSMQVELLQETQTLCQLKRYQESRN